MRYLLWMNFVLFIVRISLYPYCKAFMKTTGLGSPAEAGLSDSNHCRLEGRHKMLLFPHFRDPRSFLLEYASLKRIFICLGFSAWRLGCSETRNPWNWRADSYRVVRTWQLNSWTPVVVRHGLRQHLPSMVRREESWIPLTTLPAVSQSIFRCWIPSQINLSFFHVWQDAGTGFRRRKGRNRTSFLFYTWQTRVARLVGKPF